MKTKLGALIAVVAIGSFLVSLAAGQVNTPAPGSTSVRIPMAAWGRVRVATDLLLGWRIGTSPSAFRQLTFSEAAANADKLGLGFIEGGSSQKVSPEISKNLDYNLSEDEAAAVKNRLAALRLKMQAYRVDTLGSDESSMRKLFAFAKNLGVETIISDARTASLPAVDKLANEFAIDVALEPKSGCLDSKRVLAEIEGRSRRIGVSADVDCWLKARVDPLDALSQLKGRLLVLNLTDESALGPDGRVVALGSGAARLPDLFRQIYRMDLKPLWLRVNSSGAPDTFAGLSQSLDGLETSLHGVIIDRVHQLSLSTVITSPDKVLPEDRQKIEAAVPREAMTAPKKPRKMLVMDLQLGYYHPTVAHVNLALDLMAKYTNAYQVVFSNDLDNLKYEKLHQFDALFLNSVVGQVFLDPEIRTGLTRFVREGGGLIGFHGASYAALDWPEYGEMIGAEEGPHRVETPTVKIDDPKSPLTAMFEGQGFTREDEFYHFLPNGSYSRDKLHVLFSIDNAKSDMTTWHVRPDGDYGLAWIKTYGSGRVFNCALGHTATFFMSPQLARFMLAGIQFALGDLDADTTPSAKIAAAGPK